MSDIDLATALTMFKQGAQEFAFGNALRGATEQVNQIKASALKEDEQRAALQQVSNNLVASMASTGVPATTIAQVAGAIGPKQFGSSTDMFKEGVLTGNAGLQNQARQVQEFENDPKFELAKLKHLRATDPIRALQFQALQDERFAKHIEQLDKRVDTQTARYGNIGKLQQVNNTISDARSLLEGDIYNMNVAEVAKTLDRILSSAAPTIAGTEHVTPNTLEQWKAKSKEFLTSKPQKVNIPEFVAFYKKTLDRIEGINKKIIRTAQKNVIEAHGSTVAKMNPEGYAAWVKAKLGQDADIDPKTGKVSFRGPDFSTMKKVIKFDKKAGKEVEMLEDETGKLYYPD